MQFEPIDDDSARCHKNDCEMYVCPVAKGIQLRRHTPQDRLTFRATGITACLEAGGTLKTPKPRPRTRVRSHRRRAARRGDYDLTVYFVLCASRS
jgi:hypothetical protein